MDKFIIGVLLFFGTVILSNIISIFSSFPLVNEVAQARVRIDGYQSNGIDGIVVCQTSLGNIVHLIDIDQKMRCMCVRNGGKYVRVRFKVGVSLGLLARIKIYIIGIEY